MYADGLMKGAVSRAGLRQALAGKVAMTHTVVTPTSCATTPSRAERSVPKAYGGQYFFAQGQAGPRPVAQAAPEATSRPPSSVVGLHGAGRCPPKPTAAAWLQQPAGRKRLVLLGRPGENQGAQGMTGTAHTAQHVGRLGWAAPTQSGRQAAPTKSGRDGGNLENPGGKKNEKGGKGYKQNSEHGGKGFNQNLEKHSA